MCEFSVDCQEEPEIITPFLFFLASRRSADKAKLRKLYHEIRLKNKSQEFSFGFVWLKVTHMLQMQRRI